MKNSDDKIELKERLDDQIKLRGLGIEIGEIESNISQFSGIKENIVVIEKINNIDYLCAYFTSKTEIDINKLKEYLEERLTEDMIPEAFIQLEEMPKTENGKINIKELPTPKLGLELIAPKTETEKIIFDIASSISQSNDFGITDDLYAIGFTSLTLMKLNSQIYQETGVDLSISKIMDETTIKNIAKEIDETQNTPGDLDEIIESSKNSQFIPLTENQIDIYNKCCENPDEAYYNLPSVIRFDKSIDAEKLRNAIIKTIDAYPYLKTRIVLHGDQLMHKKDDSIAIEDIPIVELSKISDEEISEFNSKKFDLLGGQLFRAKIYETNDETILFFDIHHIIADEESLNKLFQNFAKAYEGKEIENEVIDGYTSALIEKENENNEEYISSEKYFHDLLTQEVDSTVLTPNLNGNPDDGELKSISRNINPQLVRKFCADKRISPNVLFMAGTILNLNKYTFSDKTLLTTLFNGRLSSKYYNTQGFLAKTLPIIAINENREITVRQFLTQIDKLWKETIKHTDYPYRKISEEYQLKPEFLYAYNHDEKEITINNTKYHFNHLDSLQTNYKVAFDVNESQDNIELKVLYNNQLYSEQYIKVFLNGILITIEQFIKEDIEKLRINEIELNKNYEIPTFSPVENPILHKRFETQAKEKPNDIALVASDETLTYDELNKKANRIANALIKKGVKPKNNVLIMLPRDSTLIASILGILKAGCAYIPIDLEYPQERINYIYENSQAKYIISDEEDEKSLNVNELLKEENTSNPDVDINPDDLAYMIYTSGTTGNPKGVMITHENICNQVENPKSTYESLLCITTVSFDVSVDDILTSLSNGLKLIFADDNQIKNIKNLTELIKEEKPEVADFTPSRLASHLEVNEFCEAIGCLKCLFLGGEQFSTKVYENFRKYSDAIVYNSYGPTETTITSNNKNVTDVNDITVGFPLHNYVTDVRDIDGKLLPQGVMGELYIGGVGVGKGYYNMPEKTEEVFLTINNIPYYRSGDYAIENENGEIEILGRIDNQIKLRGLRIEIGEIESNINKYPSIKQSVIVIKEINNNDHLCAYYTADEEIEPRTLKEFIKDKLTKYMIPTAYMQLDEMPQTPNGKIDTKALPEPKLDLENVEAESELEEKLFKIAAELINTDQFGVTDDLQAIGFTSLILMKLNSLIYSEMGVNLDISILFNEPTIRKLVSQIENTSEESSLEEYIKLAQDLEYFPLTENQLGIYYECMQNPDEIMYTLPAVIRFDNDVDAEKLKEAVIKVIEAHPYIKTRIITTDDGTLKQQRCENAEIDEIEIVKIESISNEEIIKNDVKAFSFGDEQLFRFKIYETQKETVLFSDIHHIISDGVSQNYLFADIANAYENRDISEEIVDGYVYSLIEKDSENSEKYNESKEFFDEKLSQEIESTVLTPNLNGNPDEGKIKTVVDTIDADEIKEFCNKYSLSQNAVFLSVITLTLNKYTFSDKTLITTIFNGRSNPSYFTTQGFLVKTLPLIFNNENRQVSIKEFINEIDGVWKDTISHDEYPYINIAENYQLKPEFFFAYQEFMDSDDIIINNKTYEEYDLEDEDLLSTSYKINFDLFAFDDDIKFKIDYNDQLYSEDYIKTFINSMKLVLNQYVDSNIEKLRICDIELERDYEIPTFSPVENPILHKRFETRSEEKPNDIALVASDETLTYAELNKKANKIANALIKKGVKPKNNVLIMLPRDSNLIASILGILKAGCAYIPIDLEYPQERINYIYENSQADYIISDKEDEKSLNVNELLKEADASNPDVDISPDDLAYMIYTSGTTGNPKGVMISHENICNQVENPKSTYESLLCLATVSFDVSVDDILTSLSNGLKLILASDVQIKNIPELITLIEEEKPEVSEITPSRLSSYLEVPEFCDAISCLKCVFLGGEQFSTKVYENFRKYSDAIVYNSYGPTETTITSNNKEITDINDITVGYPLHNYVTDVRDIDGKLLPQGLMGELYIGGVSVGKGYYNMPEKTEEVFLTINNIPYYRSGDYAIENENGEIEILGRIDNQIKLRGLRIEIGEIESNINKYPSIKQSVIVIKEINNNDHLCAYYTADEEIEPRTLKEFIKDKLTKYMVPTAYMQLDEMPQTPNGKIDTKALPEPKLDLENVKAETELEEKLFKIAAELINTDQFGVTDDLQAIGFTSLILMKLNSLIYTEIGVNLDISTLFNEPTIRKLTSQIENTSEESSLEEYIKLAQDLEYFPLTQNQLGIYYECMQNPDEIKYTMPTVIRFDNDVDAKRLKEAVITVIEAHPYIKTRIITTDDGTLKQYRNDDIEIDEIEIVEVESISDEEIIKNDIRAYSFGDEQLFRFKIYKTQKETVLFSDFHHIITDGVSQNYLFGDIANAYENRDISEELVDGYVYSLIEKDTENSEKYNESEEFFNEKLSQEIESTVLTPNLNGNPDEGKIETVLDTIDSDEIKEFCNKYSLSQNAVFLSVITLTLNKYTFSDKTLITTIFNGRSNPYYFTTQGFLVKTLPLIFNNENRKISIKEFINGIDEVWKDTISHDEYPYTNIAEKYQLKPEFFFAYQEYMDSGDIIINDKAYEEYDLADDELLATAYKINFDLFAFDDEIKFRIDYNDQLYSEDYIKTFINSMKLVLNQYVNSNIEKLRICDIELEKDYEIPTFSPVENPILHKRFEKQVEMNPENIALVANNETLTYDELNKKANKIANALIRKGVKPKNNVLIMLPRDSNLIASILGILKAGCAYIPIDLEYPQERINYIYENSQADYIISDKEDEKSLNVNKLLEEENNSNPDVYITPDDLAYMIYTSGTTGNPKGVMISHENICNQVENPKSTYESLLCLATVSFDVSVDDILTSLSNGLKLILASDVQIKNIPELITLIEDEKPEVSEITPSRLSSYLEVPEFCDAISCLKCVFLGGEQFSTKVYENFRKYSDAIVYNSYGPTETTITSNNKEITDINDITVGYPLHNYVTDVRDIDGKLLPQGLMGELYIGGVSVGKGYYNMPEKTEEVFLTINNIPYYRSGDYAIENENGEIEILGRIDNQIKLRGLRIEIGEIESNINKYPSIKQSVIVIKEINNNDHLCAYYTADEEIEPRTLKEFIKDKLTKYMVPTAYMQLDEMPQTPNGKIDTKALPEPKLDLENVEAETELEEKLFKIAAELINTDQFGVTDDLQAIGFTSLILMKLNSLIYTEIGVNLDISILFNEPTIRKLASQIEGSSDNESDLEETIELAKSMDYFPLTDNQLGVYYECIQSPDEIKYTMPTVIRFDNDVDAEKLKESVIKAIESYPYIKTRIIINDEGELKQKRCDDVEIDEIEIVEVESISDEDLIKNDVRAFSFGDEQLCRFKIYKTQKETVLFSDFHHIITDGVSQINFFDAIANIYEGKEISAEIVDGYVYSLIEDNLKSSDSYLKAKEFFDKKLSQEIESTVLTPNINGNPDEGKLKTVIREIDFNEIKEFCNRNSISQYELFLSGLSLALNKYTFSDKTLITTIFNGRSNPYYYNTQGFLVKTLPLIFNNENRQITIKEFIKEIGEVWKDTISNSIYPYTYIAEDYQLKPEFFFSYHEFLDTDASEINGREYEEKELISDELTATEYKINFDIDVYDDKIEFVIQYNDELYTEDYIKKFIDSMQIILNQFIRNDINELMICDVELETESEIPIFSPVETPFIHKRFEKQVEENPNAIALVATDNTLTNNELNIKANRIANALIKKGVNVRSNVLAMLPRDSNLIATIIGILKAGCTFIPIDLEYPQERIDYIYENSQADYIITEDGKGENTLDIYELLEEKNTSNPNVEISPDDLAYMIYTSGSTGNPKGVMIGHKNACNQTEANPKCKYNNLLSIATIAFDTSLEDILTGITNGIKIILANDSEIKNIVDLINLIKEHKPEVMEFTPSRLISYLEVEEFCEVIDCAKCIVMGGEQFSAKAFEGVKKYCDAAIYNSYGPTEATIASNYKEITDPENITIGKALKNYVTEVRDVDGKLLPKGVMGELYIGGVGVGKGYYNMPEKTEEVFLTINNIPYYKSGDYAIELPDGDIDIKGRIDNQIKLRGLRIEIGEIESSINKFPNIKNAVVVIKEIHNNDHLCAYFTAENEIDKDNLKEFLKERLTYYMVPTVFMQLDEIPQLPNGKTDAKKLPEPKLELENVKPENETEEKLFNIVSELIENDEFGTTDDLYAIGYTSLTLMKLNTLIYKEMNVNLDISILFNSPSIKKLANAILENDDQSSKLDEYIELSHKIDYFPLTENQLGIYYECMQNPDEIKYTMPAVVRFDHDIDAEKLKETIIKVIDNHPYLKTRIITTDEGTLKQYRNDDIEIDEIEIVEVESISDEELVKNDVKTFALDNEQLFRFKIYKTADEIILFSDFHHIITDGVSQGILFEEIGKTYENKASEKEIIDGYIFSLIENDLQNSERYESAKKFFDDKLSQEIESTVLTPNLNGNPEEGKQKTYHTTFDLTQINEFCFENSISHNSLFMSALILNLNKYTYSDETLITTIFNGRTDPNYYNTQGFLVKTLPLIIKNNNREQSVRNFIKSVDKVWIDSINNSIYPYTKIANEHQLKPEFFYSFEEGPDSESFIVNGKDYENYELNDESMDIGYKIDISIFKNDTSADISLSYNDQLYSEEYIEKFLNSMQNVLIQFAENDINKFRICDVELETSVELPTFIPLETPFIHKRFEKHAKENPDNYAIVTSSDTLTNDELNRKANRIANGLIKRGVKPKSNILIMLPRTSNLIVTILGILKAGCALIPIDLEYPKERIEYIYKNSQADYIIANATTDSTLDVKELLEEENENTPDVEISKDDLAYMIYTSGSTGNPKGVMISHENACNEVEGNPKCEYNNLLSIATIAFDTSLEDILTGLTNGIKIIFADDNEIKNIVDLIHLIKEFKPEVMEFTPSRLLSYLEVEEFCDIIECAKCIVMGGEQFSAQAFNGVKRYTDAVVYNSYGPTEATIASNYKAITDPNNITVGKALKNYVTEVRDIDGKLLPQGVMGELYIGGIGVGKGYYNMPDKTEEVYLSINGIPYYRSGDYAIQLPNGEIDIKGRIDNQIKLRGLRIEIGEIESNISRFPNIKHNIVVIKEINNSDHLCAYFTAEADIDINLLKRYLQSKLTKYMVPSVFIQIDEMPQLPNGKTDVKALPEPSLALNYVEAETETEKRIFELVSSLTSAEEFGVTDDLYSLGFTSLTLMKLNSLIYNETDVNIEITDLFNNPTIQSLADKIDNNIDAQIDIEEIIKTAETMDLFPLTANQLGIYYECMQTGEIKYTMPSAIRFNSDVDPYKLKEAIIKTIEAHPYLKTRIITTSEGELKQKRCDGAEIDDIEIVEVDSISNKEMMEKDIKYIPLDDNQLFRFKIYQTPEETVLFSDIHHIITDGVSQDILFEDIISAYNNEELSTEIVDGFAYSLIEAELSENEVSKEYYQNKFAKGFESTILTPDLNGNPDEANIKLIEEDINSTFVRLFCQDHSISPNVLFMSATILALNKFTFSDKSLITTIFNGRSNSNYYSTQGMLVKTLPIMVSSEKRDMMIEDFIKVVDKTWKESLIHSNYPYTKLSEEYQLKPEFFYAYHGAFETDNLEMDGNTYVMEELDGTVATDYKINLDIYDDGESIEIYIEYNDQIYSENYAREFLNAIKYILVQFFVNDMDKLRINDIELAPNFLLPEFEELVNPFLHKRFEAQVEEKPDETALVASDESLSYDELNKKANRVANALIKKGVRPKSNILIMLPRTSDLIAAIIGVLKAGCAFIPLDLKFPKERIDYIYENSQADYIINVDGVALNSLSINELLEENNTANPNIEISKDDLAYMIYTSGSTGNPKGVMISHENACNEVEGNPKCEYNNLLSIATIAFDTSLEDILTGITNGIKIIFANDDEIKSIVELIRLIKREKPEVMEFTPSRLLSYLEFEEFCDVIDCAKCIVMGGEQFSAKAFNGVKKYCDAAIYNSYGPTEATIASNYKEITDPENITIGKALKNYVTEVRDIDGKLLPKGVIGELYIGGVGVGKGYYNMPQKTQEVYLTIDDIPYYKSGDYAVELPDGDIDIKGRIDNQIKLRGLRIEIGEIESNISSFPNIKQNIVVIKEIRNNEHLCAYFTAEDEINKEELKSYLSERLTQYMVPTVFMQLDEMPQTPNGKTDVKALPEPELELKYVAPENDLEKTICEIYSSILDIEIVGAEDNFFEIGGTSLIASKLIIELLKQDYDVKYDDIFRNQTPRTLAKFLSGDETGENLDADIIENYDYTLINQLLKENTFENFDKGTNLELGNVLLTGVTGFLGIHVLYEYIKNEEGIIYCMLRKGKFDSCEERLIDLMNYYFTEDFSDLIGSRIILSEGDITSLDDFKKLEKYPIDTLINCAAIVKHYTHDDYIFRVNVDGVVNGLEFCEAHDINYVQISTTSVLDEYDADTDISDIHCDEKTLYWGQDLSNKYLNSKFLAERMVLEKAVAGLNTKIIRVGNLMSRYSDGVFQKNFNTNAFLNNIKAIKNIKATIPSISEEIVELSPIDYVAKATITLAKTPKESTIFHAVSDKLIPTSDIFDALKSFGYEIEEVTPEEFRKIYEENMDENIQGIITADLTIDDFDYEDDEENDDGELVKIDQTLDILSSLGFEWPEIDEDYLKRFIKYLNEVHYFD